MSKYRAIKVYEDNIVFDSIAENKRYRELKLLVSSKVIKDLRVHTRLPIVVNGQKICAVEADFDYKENGKLIFEDVKGMDTPISKLKRKLIAACWPEIDWRVIQTGRKRK